MEWYVYICGCDESRSNTRGKMPPMQQNQHPKQEELTSSCSGVKSNKNTRTPKKCTKQENSAVSHGFVHLS